MTSQLPAAPLRSQPKPLFNSPKAVSFLPTPAHLFLLLPRSYQLFSTTVTPEHLFSALLTSSRPFSTLATPSQLFPPLFTEMLCAGKLLHPEASKPRNFCTEKQKLLHREAFTQSTLLQRDASSQSKLAHRFETDKLLRREAFR